MLPYWYNFLYNYVLNLSISVKTGKENNSDGEIRGDRTHRNRYGNVYLTHL